MSTEEKFDRYVVLGGGPMSLVLSALLAETVRRVYLWLPDNSQARQWLKKRSATLFDHTFEIPANVEIITGHKEFHIGSQFICVASSSRQMEEIMPSIIKNLNPGQTHAIVTFTKGFISPANRKKYQVYVFSQYIEKLCAENQISAHVAVVSGPSLLTELHENRHAFFQAGVRDRTVLDILKDTFRQPFLHWNVTDDMAGVEIGGILKNPLAIISGMLDRIPGTGSNVHGEVVARGFAEMLHIGVQLGARQETLMGRTGLADLVATSSSPRSRNRSYGIKFVDRLLSGKDHDSILQRIELFLMPQKYVEREIIENRDIIEGGLSLSHLLSLTKEKQIEAPLYSSLFDVLARRKPPEALLGLLTGGRTENQPMPVARKKARLDLIASGRSLSVALKERVLHKIINTTGMQARIKKQALTIISSLEKRLDKARKLKKKAELNNIPDEIKLWKKYQSASAEEERYCLERIIEFYSFGIADTYVPVIRGSLIRFIAPFRFILGGLQPGSTVPHIGGPVEEIIRLAEQYTVFYAPTHRTHIDSVELAYALSWTGLPLPRFAAASVLMSNPLWARFLKSMGAYSVDRESTRNLLYLECLTRYTELMLEAGIPSLVYPEGTRARQGHFEPIKTGLLSTAVEAFRSSGAEVLVIPMTISHRWVPEDEEFTGKKKSTGFWQYVFKRKKVYLDFGDPIHISRHIQAEDPTEGIATAIMSSWKKTFRILPNHILAAILHEADGIVPQSELENRVHEFIKNRPANYVSTDPALIVKKGIKQLASRKLIYQEGEMLLASDKELIEYYGNFIPVNESDREQRKP